MKDIKQILDEIEQKNERSNMLKEKVEEFLINQDETETKMTLDFAKQILALEVEIKRIKDDIKEIKKEAKDEGVAVNKVIRVLNQLKRVMKTNQADLNEMEEISLVLENDVDIKTQIAELIRKN